MIKLLYNKKSFEKLCLVVVACFFTLVAVEVISIAIITAISKNSSTISGDNLYDVEVEKELGQILKKNNTHTGIKSFSDGRIIYEATYTTDQYRRRVVGQKFLKNNQHLILFGCSQTYGEGLNDTDTLQYMLYKKLPQYNVYNYAVHGYGPHQMLAILQKGRLVDEVPSKEGVAIFGLIDSHFERVVGTSRYNWLWDSPYYYLDKDGLLKRNGSFWTGRSFITRFYEKFQMWNFAKLINLRLPIRISKKHVQLTYEIIAESKRQYEKQFDGKFYVMLLSDQSNNIKELIKRLQSEDIPVISPKFDVRESQYHIEGDGHNNANFNELLSEQLAEYILSK